MNNKHNRVLVIIVSFNSMPWVKRCYDSLRTSSIKCDIITIDNGSTDGTTDYIRSHYPEVELVEQDKNIGFGLANNIGLQKMLDEDYKFAYLLNQDAWVLSDTFETLIATSKKNPEYGILSPMQMQADLKKLDKKFYYLVNNKTQKLSHVLNEKSSWPMTDDVYEISFVMAAHWLITQNCVKQTGGFSPSFFLYGEDDNYIDRAHYWNFKTGFVPKALAVHDRQDSNWSIKKRNYIDYYSSILSKCSNPQHPQSLLLCIKNNLSTCIKNKNKEILLYTLKLIRDFYSIKKNLKSSRSPRAFLSNK